MKDALQDALTHLESEILDAALQERFDRMAALARRKEHCRWLEKAAAFLRRTKGMVAIGAVLCGLLAVLLLPRGSQPGTLPIETTAPPQYTPAYDTPDLEILYEMEPFCDLLPRKLP